VKKELSGTSLREASDDMSLPICWRGREPFKSLKDVKKYFKPLALSFINAYDRKAKIQYDLPPEAYLIISVSPMHHAPSFLSHQLPTLCQNSLIYNNIMIHVMHIYGSPREMFAWEF
jgi:hypothetical protein